MSTACAPSVRSWTRHAPALLVAAAVAGVYSIYAPRTGDLAAQTFRSQVVPHDGLAIWNNYWFAGHHLPAYSVLFPLLGAIATPTISGAIAAFVATLLFLWIVRPRTAAAQLAGVWFAIGMAATLVSGRLTFALGVAVGVATVAMAIKRWWIPTAVLGAATALASPVAGAFLALVALPVGLSARHDPRTVKTALAMLIAPTLVVIAMARLFPEGGDFPFPVLALVQVLAITALCFAIVPRDKLYVRLAFLLYGVACVGAYVIRSPMGANAVRLGALIAGPVLLATASHRRKAVAIAALAILAWQWESPIYDLVQLRADPSLHAAYYQPVIRRLRRQASLPVRIEIPPTENHWETTFVARRVPLARGWERQLDRKYDALFYGDQLTPSRYRNWLVRNGIQYVVVPALSRTHFDYAGQGEVTLIRRGLPYLVREWHSRDWTVFKVRGSKGLVDGPGYMTNLDVDTFRVRAVQAGSMIVKIHWSPYFRVASGDACLTPTRSGWTRMTVQRSELVEVKAEVELDNPLDAAKTCSSSR